MPSGPKKRKAAKKKQVKDSNNSNSSSTTHSHHGESDGGELSSPAAQDQHNRQLPFTEGEKREASLYQNKSLTVGSSENDGKEDEGNMEIDKGSKSRKSHDSSSSSSSSGLDDEPHVFEKNVVVLESAPVVELVQPIESLPEKIDQKVKDSTVETSSVAESVVESVLVENEAAKLASPEENGSSEARDDVAVSTHPMGSVSGGNGADCVNEPETSQDSDKQPLVAPASQAGQTTSWKGCCGILELFSSSDR